MAMWWGSWLGVTNVVRCPRAASFQDPDCSYAKWVSDPPALRLLRRALKSGDDHLLVGWFACAVFVGGGASECKGCSAVGLLDNKRGRARLMVDKQPAVRRLEVEGAPRSVTTND